LEIGSAGQLAQHFFELGANNCSVYLSCSSPAPAGEEDKKNYLFVLTTILMWDTMGLLKQKRNIK